MNVFAINGSPQMDKGNTAMVLAPFVEGMAESGAEVEVVYASRLKVKPCACGEMSCWNSTPGECVIRDDMQTIYPKLRRADILLLATPVYIPLPGAMQNVINRLCPLLDPILEWRDGRTRARFRDDVRIRKMALVAVCGWWELGNFGTVVRIADELAEDASVEFAGSVLRPHAHRMKADGEFTDDGLAVVEALRMAGRELIAEGRMNLDTLRAIARPLISEQEIRRRYAAQG
jgi:multimeric flavodoxin WrbA